MAEDRPESPRPGRIPLGVALGILTAGVGGLFLAVAAVAGATAGVVPPARRPVRAAIRRYASALVRYERRRLARFHDADLSPGATGGRREVGYLAVRLLPGVLGLLAYGLLAVGVVLATIVLLATLRGDLGVADALVQVVVGAALFLVNVQAVVSVGALDVRLARRLLGPSRRELLEDRVRELVVSRAGVIAAVDAERQRIERDLHDGLQQRLVALGMLLGRARRSRDAARTAELLAQAHSDVQQAVVELREVAWRVYPSALDDADLGQALELVAQRSDVPVRIRCDLPARPARQVETVLYFVACEALTNAAKHAAATLITVEIGAGEGAVRMAVRDDGVGGADPAGRGLSGLARRVGALDGRLCVDSPAGGPTTVSVELPCG
ncbi:two-component sensor histidine kinase [Micromonospora echinospora]|uniref:histidine kinase n=1 Tax=Micromonospora echinospora TaxID=1877 RepID=A0A1C4ZQS5_MICEC|nr:histidine kinase [Micromonospora echinospora]OZV81721.1 two-component sensor histidine kinase [Micromonospora echinospora]SCF35417.1 Signal transduction histidine kinase [Micromonospora echinospora]